MFVAAGFLTLGTGKTYHDTVQGGVEGGLFEYDRERSWSPESLPYRNPCWTQGVDCGGCPDRLKAKDDAAGEASPPASSTGVERGEGVSSPSRWSIGNVSTDWCERATGDLSDVLTTDHALMLLSMALAQQQGNSSADSASSTAANASGRPFYLAVGYHKPHLPWIFKPEHLELYPADQVQVVSFPTLDPSVPPIAFNDCDSSSPWEALSTEAAVAARRAYYAATTGMDEEVGRLLQGLEDLGGLDTTAVVLHGDHGWQLGERAGWRKNCNWENAVRVPLVVAVPWLNPGSPGNSGGRTSAFAELVDLMPTLADLAGVPVSGWGNPDASNGNLGGVGSGLATVLGDERSPPDGVSLLPILNGSVVSGGASGVVAGSGVKEFAFSQYTRAPKPAAEGGDPSTDWEANGIDHKSPAEFEYMGYSVRAEDWRYTAWYPWLGPVNGFLRANWSGDPYAQELYDWRGANNSCLDYDSYENENVAQDPANADVVSWLNGVVVSHFS